SGLWTEFRAGAVDLKADHRGAWRTHLGGESPGSRGPRWRADGGRCAFRGEAAVTMSGPADASVHASAVKVGSRAVLIRGPSGAGKSRLAFDLILAGRAAQIPPAILVGDDRVHLDVRDGQLIVRPAPALAGLIEIRGLGLRCCDFASEVPIGLVVDLSAD